jgi:hypothetical protein
VLDEAAKTKLRRQALDWLRADLTSLARQLDGGRPTDRTAVQQELQHWQEVPDLESVRAGAELDKLPAGEREAFTQLWADVAALRKRAEEKGKEPR